MLVFNIIPFCFLLIYLESETLTSCVLLIQNGLTALHTAIIGQKDAVISHLLRKGASPHFKDRVRI